MAPKTTDEDAFVRELTELCNRYKLTLIPLQYKIILKRSNGGAFKRYYDVSLDGEWISWLDDDVPEL